MLAHQPSPPDAFISRVVVLSADTRGASLAVSGLSCLSSKDDPPDLISLLTVGVAVGSVVLVGLAESAVFDDVDVGEVVAFRAELERLAEDWPLLTTLPTLVPSFALAS